MVHGQLHGRGALFEAQPPGLLPRLIGLRPDENVTVKSEHPGVQPVLVLTGGRGLGKTAVLDEVEAAYTERTRRGEPRKRTPLARVDCEDEQFAAPPHEESTESWSPLWQALLVIAEQLTEPVRAAGQLTFPRLTAGLVAVRAGEWSGGSDSERIRRELTRILLLNEHRSRFSLAGRWAARVAAKVIAAATGQGPYLAAAVEATLEALSEGVTSRKEQRPSTWYRAYPNAGGNAKRGLLLLSGNFRAGGTSREHAERWLVRALLADLTEGYSGIGSHLTRIGRPVVLLDNAGGVPGPGLLDAVLRDRAEGVTDPAVVVATVRGRGVPAGAVRRELAEVARASGPPGAPGGGALGAGTFGAGALGAAALPAGSLAVPLPPLSPDDTLHITGAVCDDFPFPPQLPHAVHRLTGGNPLGIVLTARAARRHPDRAGTLAALLTEPVQPDEEDPLPAYGELLRRLVPADRLDELTVLAAAHDHDSAVALATAQLPDDFGSSGVRTLRARLLAEGVAQEPGHFVGDRFVRTLLLLRLHQLTKWRDVHEVLIRHYATDHAVYRLHHELALGDTDGAVAELRDSFTELPVRVWLDTLRFVASAPCFGPEDQRVPIALGRRDTAGRLPPENAGLHLRVRRLLHAVWQVSDPLVLPDRRVCDRLRFELEQLSDLRTAGGALLFAASRAWPQDALAGRPLSLPEEDENDDEGDV
ncbi:hypothetical protein [Streptomyces sp. ST1015]|uniref:hypothetical protein n=1 Tax=Streptomyces sp. ST1015 TaxID=1848900 RepID=UPI001CA6CD42|nr:hypothetical protein [Streptomyces sp. ST1015]QZZ29475.1 hypothetical protein A7X85_27435 [Streptomyces sp. ST1015]